jgi:hypothetical protein
VFWFCDDREQQPPVYQLTLGNRNLSQVFRVLGDFSICCYVNIVSNSLTRDAFYSNGAAINGIMLPLKATMLYFDLCRTDIGYNLNFSIILLCNSSRTHNAVDFMVSVKVNCLFSFTSALFHAFVNSIHLSFTLHLILCQICSFIQLFPYFQNSLFLYITATQRLTINCHYPSKLLCQYCNANNNYFNFQVTITLQFASRIGLHCHCHSSFQSLGHNSVLYFFVQLDTSR